MKTRLQIAAELLRVGRLAEARAKLTKELRLAPQSAPAMELMGAVASAMGRHEEAIGHLRRAASLAPASPGPPLNLGMALLAARHAADAADTLAAAVRRWPDIPEARLSYGNALLALGRRALAADQYRAAMALNPRQAGTCARLALALHGIKDYEAACQLCEHLLKLDPSSATGHALLAIGRQMLCDWDGHERLQTRLRQLVAQGRSEFGTAFASLLLWDDTPMQRRCAELEAKLYSALMKLPPPAKLSARRKDRIRVAYVSGDFRMHPMTALITGMIEAHDRARFETIGVSLGEDDESPERRRLMSAFDGFMDVRDSSTDAIIAALRAREVDIAVDLMGYTTGCRPAIFLQRVAPTQVAFVGFPGTTGMAAMDYLIVDPFIAAGDVRGSASERLVILSDCYWPNSYRCDGSGRVAPTDQPSRESCGLPVDAFVFCSFNQAQKLTPEVLDSWMRILRAVEGSVLWLLSPGPTPERNLRREAERRGVDPRRLIFADRVGHSQHLARNAVPDLHLDTFPYTAHTTASDALWAGCPILTRAGGSFTSRVCGSLLTTIGVPQLIAASAADYEAMAVRLAQDKPMLAELRQRIAYGRSHSPLFDTQRFCRNLERAYAAMNERSHAGHPAAEIDVRALDGAQPPVAATGA